MPDIFDEVDEVKPDVFDEVESERESLRSQTREARAEAYGNKAISGLANIGERIAYTSALLGAKADPTGVVHNMLVREGYEVPTVIPPQAIEQDIRTVGEFGREALGNLGIKPGPIAPEIERPLTEFAAENVAGLAEAAPQLTLGKFQPRPVARYFQGQMAAGLPGSIEQVVQSETPEEKLKTGLQLGANVAFPAAIELGLRKQPIRIPDIPGSVLRMPEGAEPRIEPPPAIDIGPKPSPPRPLPEIKSIASETGVPEETVAKGVRVEANDHPEVAASNPELLPTLVKDELKLDKAAYDKDADPGKAVSVKAAEPSPERPPKNPFHQYLKPDENMNNFLKRATDEQLIQAQKDGEAWEKWLKEEQDFRKAQKDETWKDLNPLLYDGNHFTTDVNWERTRRAAEKPTLPPPATEAQAKPAAAPTEAKTEVSEGKATELSEIIPENIKSDPRLDEPGITRTAKPNSLIIQLRDLESIPVREVIIESKGDPLADSKAFKQVLKQQVNSPTISQRESMAVSTGQNGRAIYHFSESPSGTVWTSAKDLIEARKQIQQPPPQPSAGIEGKQTEAEGKAPDFVSGVAGRRPSSKAGSIRWDIRNKRVQGLKIKQLYRKVGANQAIIDINGQRFTIDNTARLKTLEQNGATIEWSKEQGVTSPRTVKTEGDWQQYLLKYPKLDIEDFRNYYKNPELPQPGPGAQTVGEPQKAQIEQLTDAFKGIEAEKTPLKEQVKEAFAIGEKFSGTKDLFSRALSGLKSSGDWFIQKWKAIPDIDNLLRAKGDLSAQLQANSWRTQKWIKQALKAIPRKRDQAAIAKWIDAGGDRAELERGFRETKPEFKQAYLDALNLKGDLLVAAQNAQNYFEARLQEAVDAGVLKDGVEDYIHRIYESRPDVAEKAVAHVQDGILKANPALAKKRVFQFDWEAEKLGYKPVQSFITRLAVYESSLAKALAAREFIRKATTMKAADGRPIVDVKGVGIPLEDAATGERTGTLIKPQFNPAKANVEGTANYRGDYVNKEFPALSKWKWVSEDAAGKPILVQGDVAIHPDYVHRINALLEPSRVRYGRYGKVLKPAMAVSSTVKQTMLDLSMFHQVQITVHGLEHKVQPGRIGIPGTKLWMEIPRVPGFAKVLEDIDLDNPNVQGLLKGGISLGGEYSPYHAEGLVGSSLTRHIPILGPLTEAYHDWLFQSYIPRIKMTMALNALERNRARYKGELTEEQILHKTARQANSAFGELNYVMLERSKTAQDIARLIMLAPDFLEARGRFAAEALTKGGKSTVPGFGNEQRAALLLGALTLYVTARMANKMINDQYHFEPENAFSVVKDGHAYSLRTVQGDILHLLAKPLQFWMNRLNPVYGRTLLQIATGRDYFGRKRSVPETLWDSVANTVPIALRSSRERALWESIANSMGIQAKRWSDVDDAFTLAKKWKDAHGIGEKGEFIYDPDKDPLRPLKIALSHGDDAGAAKEIGKLTEGGTKIKKLNDYFDRYASMPFTGSAANDRKWQKELSEDEKKTVLAAREHKKSIKQLYLKARGQYFAAKNNPK